MQVIPFHGDRERIGLEPRAALELQAHFGALLPRHAQRDLFDVEARNGGVVDGREAVAREDAGAGSGAAGGDAEHGDGAVHVLKRQAGDGEVAPLQRIAPLPVVAGEEQTVRIQRVQDAIDRGPHHLRVGDRIHVVEADVVQDAGEGLQLLVGGALLRHRVGQSDRRTAGQQRT